MDSHETTMPNTESTQGRREVEFEMRLPSKEDLKIAREKAEPLRRAAEDVMLTGIGLSVLASRAVLQAIRAARRAGEEAAEHPGPVTRALVGLVGRPDESTPGARKGSIPILPISDYDTRDASDIITRLPGLTREQLIVVREYELAHQSRTRLLEATEELLAAMA